MIEVELKSKALKEYVYLQLEKNRQEPLYDYDLDRIEDITMYALDFLDEPTDMTIVDLVFFNNLTSCTIIDKKISSKEVDVLNSRENLKSLHLVRCTMPENKCLTSNINSLILDRSSNMQMESFCGLKELESFRAIGCINFNIDGISKCQNISEIYLQNIDIDDIKELREIKGLRLIDLNGTKVKKKCKFNKNVTIIEDNEEFPF